MTLDETVRRYVDDKKSISAIAGEAELTKQAIRNRLRKAGVQIRPLTESRAMASRHYDAWTPENDAKLRRLWDAGKTGSAIAEAIGCGLTKSAVIGRAHRLGLTKRQHIIRNPAHRSGVLTQIAMRFGAQPFRHRSLITFLPESPRLEMQFRAEVAKAHADRKVAL